MNDGSDPEKNKIFEELSNHQVVVLYHPKNEGKGQALKTAFHHYLQMNQHSAVGVVTSDADGQHLPQDILKLSDALLNEHTQLHLGVRDFNQQKIPYRSKLGNLLTRYIFKKLCAINIIDTQTGLRAIPYSLIQTSLNSDYSGYEFEMEMLLFLASRQQMKINQVPIETIYYDKNQQSHFKPFLDYVKNLSSSVRVLIIM